MRTRGLSWDDAERMFPGCSAQWDIQNGPEWLSKFENPLEVEIRLMNENLYVDVTYKSERNGGDWLDKIEPISFASWAPWRNCWEFPCP